MDVVAWAFQSPSLRGSGRFPGSGRPRSTSMSVSIPFIAGQWSLLAVARLAALLALLVSIPFIAGQWSLPVDATEPIPAGIMFQSPSLRGSGRFADPDLQGVRLSLGFNPLHCGAVVASLRAEAEAWAQKVSIPFIAGQWSLLCPFRFALCPLGVSIPFIAGQWSLRGFTLGFKPNELGFQSPSLRGSGRFEALVQRFRNLVENEFQSPSLRGSGRF